jgi:hypothetical protein
MEETYTDYTEETPKKIGRPTKMNEEVAAKLENIFKIGGTVDDACGYALISRDTFDRHIAKNRRFAERMQSARLYPDIAAKNTVVDSIVIDKNVESAKWWLTKRRRSEFGDTPAVMQQINIAGKVEDLSEKQLEEYIR